MSKNKKIWFLVYASIFSLAFSATYIAALILDLKNDELLNFPSNTILGTFFQENDVTMIFSWVKQSIYNQSIFDLGMKLSGYENTYHHISSRGLGIYLFGIFLNIFNPIQSITLSYILFAFINCFLILYYFKKYKVFFCFFLFTAIILFSSKVFGSVLNPLHYLEYIQRSINEYEINKSFFLFYSSLQRAPNILINNIFIFLNFFVLKKFYYEKISSKKKLFTIFLLLLLTSAVDPLVFIIFISIFFNITVYKKFIKKIDNNFVLSLILIITLSLTIFFHYYNYEIVFSDNEKHGVKLGNFWTGNYIFSIEMFLIPIVLYLFFNFNSRIKNQFEIKFLLTIFVIWCFLYFFINEILASRITNRNFEILIGCISFSFLIYFIQSLNFKKFYILLIFFILHIPYIYYLDEMALFNYYLILNIVILLVIYVSLKNKQKISYKFQNIFYVLISFSFIFFLFDYNLKKNIKIYQSEINQKKFFLYFKKIPPFASLNFGLTLNAGYQKNSEELFIYNITNVPSIIKREKILNRINQIFYLYGFNIDDLKNYVKDYITLWEINEFKYTEHQLNLALLNKIIFYENYQNNYDKVEPITKLVKSYEEFLLKPNIEKENFEVCVITKYDEKYIKKNSFFYKAQTKIPLYENDYLKAFNCLKSQN